MKMLDAATVFHHLQEKTPGASSEDLEDLINDWRLPDGRVMCVSLSVRLSVRYTLVFVTLFLAMYSFLLIVAMATPGT